jgi:hypothetical protein
MTIIAVILVYAGRDQTTRRSVYEPQIRMEHRTEQPDSILGLPPTSGRDAHLQAVEGGGSPE